MSVLRCCQVAELGVSYRPGFTLLELMVVVSVIIILTSVSMPSYQQHVKMAREAMLREDLYLMRMAIDRYALDKLRAPQSIDDLISARDICRRFPATLSPTPAIRGSWYRRMQRKASTRLNPV